MKTPLLSFTTLHTHPRVSMFSCFLSWQRFVSVAFCPAMCVFVPLLAVTLHGPPSISPQHPSLCRKKERKVFLPPSLALSFTILATDWSSLRSQPWDPFPCPQQQQLSSARKSSLVHEEIGRLDENVYNFPCKEPRICVVLSSSLVAKHK